MDRIWLILIALLGLQAAPEVDDEQLRSETAAVFAYAACVQPAPTPQPPMPDAGLSPTRPGISPNRAKALPNGPELSPQPTPAIRTTPPPQAIAAQPVTSVLKAKSPKIGDVVLHPNGRYVYRPKCMGDTCEPPEWHWEPYRQPGTRWRRR